MDGYPQHRCKCSKLQNNCNCNCKCNCMHRRTRARADPPETAYHLPREYFVMLDGSDACRAGHYSTAVRPVHPYGANKSSRPKPTGTEERRARRKDPGDLGLKEQSCRWGGTRAITTTREPRPYREQLMKEFVVLAVVLQCMQYVGCMCSLDWPDVRSNEDLRYERTHFAPRLRSQPGPVRYVPGERTTVASIFPPDAPDASGIRGAVTCVADGANRIKLCSAAPLVEGRWERSATALGD